MLVIGWFSRMAPVEPKKAASPNEKIPPSRATNQYPRPDGVAAIPTIGWFNRTAPVEPKNPASPNEKIPPSRATNQYPRPDGVAAIPTIGWFNRGPADPMAGAAPKACTVPSAEAIQYPGGSGARLVLTPGSTGVDGRLPGSTIIPSEDQSRPADPATTESVPGTGFVPRKSAAWS